MKNILFPKTPYVECIFSLNTSSVSSSGREYDRYDIVKEHKKASLKRYVYQLPKYLEGKVKVGDFVLVHCATGYQPCEVVTVNALTSFSGTIQPVVCMLDIQSYCADIDQQVALKQMRQQIEEERRRLEAMVTYDLLAEKNPEFAALLAQFREAGGVL